MDIMTAVERLRRVANDPDVRRCLAVVCRDAGLDHWSDLARRDPEQFLLLVEQMESLVTELEDGR